ncbi:hypothetical protein [Planomonospora sp. ID82291]|uniref:hypothetical protein n=1 Tax=Planomonospora sp. ID82291 TaxID=2738136 RepID=UPI0018C4338D|nr:hypothetical protein [Planomonospora sp. ID82291]MBG0816638.1 hypothetical protein [Planomonospora sp. ID82291]
MTDSVLLRVCATYCHPEADEGAYDGLKRLARRPDDAEMAQFKAELRRALAAPAEAPPLYRAVRYGDGDVESFLRRLWRDLYPDEPVPSRSGR